MSDAGLAYFKDCKGLTSLDLSRTRVSDAGLAHFKDCKGLKELWLLAASRVNDVGLAHFKGCKNLTTLYLKDTRVSDAGLAHFKDCKSLTRLNIANTKVTDLSLLRGMPLKELNCGFRPERDAEVLRSIRTLEKINDKPAAEFWRDIEKK